MVRPAATSAAVESCRPIQSMASPFTTISTLSSLLLLLLLFITTHHRPASAQRQQQQLTSFNASDSPWLPSQNRTLVSPNLNFVAGFRSTPSGFLFAVWVRISSNRTIVWSLNRNRPVNSSAPLSISISISPRGQLSLPDPSGRNLWPSTNASSLVLHDDGSLVFGNWTSFDSPTDTVLAGQPVSPNGTSLNAGNFQLANAINLTFNGTDTYWSAKGAILNLTTGGILFMDGNNQMVTADVNNNPLRRLTLDPDGNLRIYSLHAKTGNWRMVWQAVQEFCAIHGTCGPNSICVPNGNGDSNTTCVCPPGYRETAGGGGCGRKTSFLPSSKFLRLDYVSFTAGPDTNNLPPLDFDRCQSGCSANASCIGFSYKFTGSQSCFHHVNRLASPYWSPATEVSMFIRVASSETDVSTFTGMTSMIDTVCPMRISLPLPPNESRTKALRLAIICCIFAIELLAGVLSFWAFLRKYSKYRDIAKTFGLEFLPAGGPKRFSYAELKAATDNFSHVLGHGGFGVVYKGVLPDRRVVAVKRLKKVAGGEAEFWAEVTIIARMHHLNLVRMWGFCAEKEQRMLVYEYIPNGSLDKYLFPADSSGEKDKMVPQKPLLDLKIRYRIALGVARAVAYLHEECLEWVLHCDIKPENILLGDDFCPKVSDFGLSKLTNKRDMVTMSRMRGTRGYMAPEWVLPGEPITAKADVYSFGMVLLEIVCGIRSFNFRRSSLESEDWFFPKWAFEKVYVEKNLADILDPLIRESFDDRTHVAMMERMVKTAIWCLQDRAEMRPSMGKVTKMLEGTVEITEPGRPAIFWMTEETETPVPDQTTADSSPFEAANS